MIDNRSGIISTNNLLVNVPAMLVTSGNVVKPMWRSGMFILTPKKQCTKCGEWKTLDQFHREKRSKDGRYWQCISCRQIKQRSWFENNKEKMRQYVREWRARNIEASRESDRLRHKERYAKDPEKYKAINQKWVDSHLEKKIAINNNRRAREKGSVGKVTDKEWLALLDKYGHRCLCCGNKDVKLTRDHVVPLDMGGTNTIDNIQPLCQSCNSKKGVSVKDYR